MQKLKKIGLFGGTFDPPHHAHLMLAEWLISYLELDLIYFIPASIHAFKNDTILTSGNTRLKLIRAAIKHFPKFKVSQIEIKRDSVSFTIDTLRTFMQFENIANAKLYYIIGLDNLLEFHLWKEPDDILNLCTVVVLNRPGLNKKVELSKYYKKVKFINSPMFQLSSTFIRQRISEGKPFASFVPLNVFKLIIKNKLYIK